MALIIQLIRILALLGFVLNLHFIYTHHFRRGEKHRHTKLCGGNKCASLVESRYARIFHVPNYFLSVFYYAGILIISFTPYFSEENSRIALVTLTGFVAGMSIYLTYILVFKLRTKCIICFTSSVVNVLIALFYIFV